MSTREQKGELVRAIHEFSKTTGFDQSDLSAAMAVLIGIYCGGLPEDKRDSALSIVLSMMDHAVELGRVSAADGGMDRAIERFGRITMQQRSDH